MSKPKTKAPSIFVPLTKVDEEQRLVYGTITQEVLDKAGEMMDYASSKPNFEKWSNEIHEASGGLSKGNLRVMHGLSVAGKLTELEFNDEEQSIEVCAKVVDEGEWEKVTEGCYTGFSVGGKYGKRWNEIVDGETVKKFTAVPNEVSLVDNPCVKSATFSMLKADGAEELVSFQLPEDVLANLNKGGDQSDPGDEDPEEEEAPEEAPVEESSTKADYQPTNAEVAAKATELAKSAGKGDWLDYVNQAREELIKSAEVCDDEKPKGKKKGKGKGDANAKAEDESAEGKPDDAKKADHTVANRLSQKWTCSDGTAFEKKADAEAHEAKLLKAEELSDVDRLAARLEKAISGETEEAAEELELPVEELDRMAKIFDVLSTPFEDGAPKLEKGMYTVNRFSNVLSDMASLSKSIKAEATREGGDSSDKTISAEIIDAVKSLGKSFITYASDQVTELLAGMDDDVVVANYDYYYRAAQEDGENQLAKDVCSMIDEHRAAADERRDELIKAFGVTEEADELELSPPMQKRFDEQAAQIEKLTKVATDAVEKVEEMAKRVKELEDEPLPRAPGHVVQKGNETFLGKNASTHEEKMSVLQDLINEHGVEGLATMMIKASQATGGVRMGMRS